jgi:hypothetical protein
VSFSFHTDVSDHPVFGALSNASFGLWVRAGTWTSAHHSPGFVPDIAVHELAGSSEMVNELVTSGVWTRVDDGYRMEHGPSSDFPMPLWRYDDGSPTNGLTEVLPDPEP